MGQYFKWVNLDKNEIIQNWIWPNGQKLPECAYPDCEETNAALSMLAGEWSGDLVIFLGDYASFKDETHPKRREVEIRLKGTCVEDFIYDECKDIAGRFDYAKEHPERKYPVYSDDSPGVEWFSYDGPFDVAIENFRYVINESQKQYVDRTRTAVRYIDPATGEIVRYDPVPEMMSSETDGLEDPEYEASGLWFGDIIRPSHEAPGVGYMEVGRNYSYWAPPIINCTDEEIRKVISDYDLNIADENILDQIAERLG